VTQIFHNSQPSHGGDRKIFEVMTSTLPNKGNNKIITKLPNTEQSYKGKVKTQVYKQTKSVNNRKTVKTVMTL